MGEKNTENKQGLTAIIMNLESHNYNEQYRALTIPEGGKFTVSVKEYHDEKNKILEEGKKLSDEFKKIGDDLENEEKRLLNQANERLSSSDEKWRKKELYGGKEISFAEVSYKENIKKARAKVNSRRDQINKRIKDLNSELKELEKTYSNVAWAWSIAKKRTSIPNGKNEDLTTGHTIENMTVGSHIYGGGFAWIEPFWDVKDSKPTGNSKNGIYVHTTSDKPQPIIAEWYAFDQSENPIKINTAVKAGSKVQLHVYTQSMYGHNIGVELKGNGKVLKANSYADTITITIDKNKSKPNQSSSKREVFESEDIFLTEVEIYDCSDAKSIKPPGEAIVGYLVDDLGNDKDGKRRDYLNVQKAVLDLYIDPIWCFGLDGTIDVLPTIHFKNSKIELKQALKIIGNNTPEITIPDYGNKPVFVDNVETNFEAFQHCRYEKITAKYNKGDEKFEIEIFPTKNNLEQKILKFPIVTGIKQARERFTIELEGVKTDECIFENTDKDHNGNVIDISELENLIVNGKGKKSNKWRLVDYKGKGSGAVKDEDANDENDNRKIDASNITQKFNLINGGSTIKIQDSFKILEENNPFILEPPTDTKLELEVGFDFTFNNSVNPLWGLINTIWPNSENIAQKYPVRLNSCANKLPLDILVYPDTKCTIQLAYNYDTKEFEELREAYHDKWAMKELLVDNELAKLKKKEEGIPDKKYLKSKKEREKGKKERESIRKSRNKEKNKKLKVKKNQSKISQARHMMGELKNTGLIDCNIAFICEFDRPYHALEISSVFEEGIAFLKKIIELKELINNIIEGKQEKTTENAPKAEKLSKKNKKRQEELEKKLKTKKSNSNWSFEFIPPSVGLSLSWYAEIPKDLNTPVMGTMIEGAIDLDPLFGFEIKYDAYQLLYKIKHPVVLAVVATLDILDEALGDNFDINLDIIVTSEISGSLKGTINTAEGSSYEQRLMKDEDDSPCKFGGKVEIKLVGEIKANGTVTFLGFIKRTIYAGLEAVATTGVSVECVTKADTKSIYVEPEIKFEGFVLSAKFEAGIVDPPKDDTELTESDGLHYTADGRIVVLDPYEWETGWKLPIISL